MIQDLIEPSLLKKVRSEIQNLSFTPKETDIYKIHQSGDLANLDGLEDSSLRLLPSLLTLRDAMYSSAFREYLSQVTGSGPLSGKKTDMAINVYTPGCHLLCHDDVIGSRRVSYILYLTDPDQDWRKEWGGALRLYPTQTHTAKSGELNKVPSPDYSVSIPPAFNQLSFFAVQPGESFHDVEEVYGRLETGNNGKDEERARMAISGWYHIPQKGEEGYEEGLEERLAQKSSLTQLQDKADKYDLPKPNIQTYAASHIEGGLPTPSSQEDRVLSSDEIDFLLKYIAPTYLTPDTLTEVSNIFGDECSICLEKFMSQKFAASVKEYVESQESQELPSSSSAIEKETPWTVARPPHKHRFLFQQDVVSEAELSPLQDILQNLLPSKAFQKWLFITTGHEILSHDCCIRRFRRGQDYTLATGYEEDSPRIEICLGITPTPGWGDDQPAESTVRTEDSPSDQDQSAARKDDATTDDVGVGGYLAYMAGDQDDHEGSDNDGGSNHGIEVPPDMSTGARSTKVANPRKTKQDPAIYRASGDDEDDGVLFSMPACWNRLGIVLRDKATMRFVKYVSRMAKGDRWDIVGEFEIIDEESDDDDEDDNGDANVAVGAADNGEDDTTEENDLDEDDESTSDS